MIVQSQERLDDIQYTLDINTPVSFLVHEPLVTAK